MKISHISPFTSSTFLRNAVACRYFKQDQRHPALGSALLCPEGHALRAAMALEDLRMAWLVAVLCDAEALPKSQSHAAMGGKYMGKYGKIKEYTQLWDGISIYQSEFTCYFFAWGFLLPKNKQRLLLCATFFAFLMFFECLCGVVFCSASIIRLSCSACLLVLLVESCLVKFLGRRNMVESHLMWLDDAWCACLTFLLLQTIFPVVVFCGCTC